MAKPAHREDTPTHKNRKSHPNRTHGSTNVQRNHSRHDSGAKMETSNAHAKDIYVSNARLARHQHVDSGRHGSGKRAHSGAGEGVHLQKVLVQTGVTSHCMTEKLIDEGRVEVDGKAMMRQGVWVDPNTSVTHVDSSRVIVNEDTQYFVLNKPRDTQSTTHDDVGRPCMDDIIGEKISTGQQLLHVGRLDAATEGLLLPTNDGELANRLMHPSYEVTKTYMTTVIDEVDFKVMRELEKGIKLDDGIVKADMVRIIDV